MGKSLEERIAERISRDGPVNRGAQRAAFLALKGDIERALSAGWSVKDIWKTLHGEGSIQVTYQAFNDYVNRFIRGAETAASPPRKPEVPPRPAPAGKTGFTINPSPNKEDIV